MQWDVIAAVVAALVAIGINLVVWAFSAGNVVAKLRAIEESVRILRDHRHDDVQAVNKLVTDMALVKADVERIDCRLAYLEDKKIQFQTKS